MIMGAETYKLTLTCQVFLIGKGECDYEDYYNYIRLYDYEGKPHLLPKFVCDKLFTIEFCH